MSLEMKRVATCLRAHELYAYSGLKKKLDNTVEASSTAGPRNNGIRIHSTCAHMSLTIRYDKIRTMRGDKK